MDAISTVMSGGDLTALLPELTAFSKSIAGWARVAILVGPVLLLIFGALYLFRAPDNMQYKFSFYSPFGVDSKKAWRFTQCVAGMVYGGLGAALTVIMLIFAISFFFMNVLSVVYTAVWCLGCQAFLVLAAFLGVHITVAMKFRRDGNPR